MEWRGAGAYGGRERGKEWRSDNTVEGRTLWRAEMVVGHSISISVVAGDA